MIDVLQIAGGFAEREPGRDDCPGRRAPNQIEPIAESNVRPSLRGQGRLDPFQECNRDDAANAAAIERQDSFGTSIEKVPVARGMLPSHPGRLTIRPPVSTPSRGPSAWLCGGA